MLEEKLHHKLPNAPPSVRRNLIMHVNTLFFICAKNIHLYGYWKQKLLREVSFHQFWLTWLWMGIENLLEDKYPKKVGNFKPELTVLG
jgi:hypothetical protein